MAPKHEVTVPKAWGKFIAFSNGNLLLEAPDQTWRIVDVDGRPPGVSEGQDADPLAVAAGSEDQPRADRPSGDVHALSLTPEHAARPPLARARL